MCTEVFPAKSVVLSTNKSAGLFYPMTPWMPAIKCKEMQSLLTLTDVVTDFNVTPGYQTAATDPKEPGSPATVVTTWYTSDTTACVGWTDLNATALDDSFWIRFGLIYKDGAAQEGGAIKQANVTFSTSIRT